MDYVARSEIGNTVERASRRTGRQGTHRQHCRRIRALVQAETYAGLGIGGNAIAEGGTIAPLANGAEDGLVFAAAGTGAVEDESAVDAAIGANDEIDAHGDVGVGAGEQRVGREQRLGGTNAAAARQGQGRGERIEFGDVGGDAAEGLLGVSEAGVLRVGVEWNDGHTPCHDAPRHHANRYAIRHGTQRRIAHDTKHDARKRPRFCGACHPCVNVLGAGGLQAHLFLNRKNIPGA